MTSPTQFQNLVDAAFAHALSAQSRADFFKKIVPEFRRSESGNDFADALVSLPPREKGSGVRPRRKVRVRERPDKAGLAFVWRVGTGTERQIVTWAELSDLPCPKGADIYTVAFARQRAAAIWEKATKDFEREIQASRVALMGKRGSLFEERVPIPLSARPHLQIDDWVLGTGNAAGTLLFDLIVVPELDEEADYRAKVHAAPRWTVKIPLINQKLWPAGVPSRDHLSNKAYQTLVAAEIKALGLKEPDGRTLYDNRPK